MSRASAYFYSACPLSFLRAVLIVLCNRLQGRSTDFTSQLVFGVRMEKDNGVRNHFLPFGIAEHQPRSVMVPDTFFCSPLFKVPNWLLKARCSSLERSKQKSSGNLSLFLLTCLFSCLTSTPYSSAKSMSNITRCPRIRRIAWSTFSDGMDNPTPSLHYRRRHTVFGSKTQNGSISGEPSRKGRRQYSPASTNGGMMNLASRNAEVRVTGLAD